MPAIPGVITAVAQLGLDSILVKPKRSIGPFKAQVTLREVHHDSLQITDHPVEQGASISDHAFKRPASVTIEAAWSNSPSNASLLGGLAGAVSGTISGVQSLVTGNNASQVKDIYEKLLKLQASAIPFDVYTGKRLYKNMLISELTTTSDVKNENILNITAELRQVIIVGTQTVSVDAPLANQKMAPLTAPVQNTGTQSLQPGSGYRPTRGGQ